MRRSKRLRLRDARLHSDSSPSDVPLRKTYFDNLSEEALANIVLHISESPRHADWQSYIPPRDALQLYRRSGPLSSAAHLLLNTLTLSPGGLKEKHGIVLERTNPDEPELLIDILVAGGPAIHELVNNYAMHPSRWTFSCMEHCKNMKRLSIHADMPLPIERMLATWSGKLQSLSLVRRFMRKTEVEAMAKHSGGLQQLDLRLGQETKGNLEKVWQTVGPTLTHLAIAVSAVEQSTGGRGLSRIAEHCQSITTLKLENWRASDRRAITDLCKRYGAQLQHLGLKFSFPGHDVTYLKPIATDCPNVLVDVNGYASHPPSIFKIFGCRLANPAMTISPNEVSLPADSCCNLMSIQLPAVPSLLASLYAKPKPRLHKIHLVDYSIRRDMRSEMQDCLDFLVENVTAIKSLTLDGVVPSPRSLRKFALANSEMQFVSFTSGYGSISKCTTVGPTGPFIRPSAGSWASVIAAFSGCRNLKEVNLSCRAWSHWHSPVDAVANACQPLRFLGVVVHVCGTQHL